MKKLLVMILAAVCAVGAAFALTSGASMDSPEPLALAQPDDALVRKKVDERLRAVLTNMLAKRALAKRTHDFGGRQLAGR